MTPGQKFWQKKSFLLSAGICAVLLLVILALAISSASKIYPHNGGISHFLKGFAETEIDGTAHKVVGCYIQNGTLYLYTMSSRSEHQFYPGQPNQNTDYSIRCKGRKYKPDFSGGRKRASPYRFKIPSVDQDRDITIALYYGSHHIADLHLAATNRILSGNPDRPMAEKDGVLLLADINTAGQPPVTQVRLSTVLVQDTVLGQDITADYYRINFDRVYIEGPSGSKYISHSDPALSHLDPKKQHLQNHHHYYFNLPEDLKQYKIIVSSITYTSQSGGQNTLKGPWEISVEK